MRFGIFAAVSSSPQADEDKASLPYQEEKCRSVALAKGWQDTGLTYVVPGKSRTKYVDLTVAEREIPELAQLIEDARRGRFDLLMLYDFNRLRDLLDPVAKTLHSYNVQIYSVNQPVEPLADFTPEGADSDSMVRGMSQIISRWQIADLKRKYKYGVTARVRKGLHSIRPPYAYRATPDKSAPVVVVPDEARVVIQMKDMFLSGKSYIEISEALKDIPTPKGAKWEHSLIRQVLLNPFYSGKVFFGRTRTVHDPHLNTTRLVKNTTPLLADGQHKALFTWDEHIAILAEDERRRHHARNTRYTFSGLLSCAVCGKTLIHDPSYRPAVWHCPGKYHTLIRDAEAYALVPPALARALLDADAGKAMESIPAPETTLADLERQRQKIHERLERGIYTDDEAERRIKQVDMQIRNYRDDEAGRLRKLVQHKQFEKIRDDMLDILPDLPGWMRWTNAKEVNVTLAMLCERIAVSPSGEVTVHLRG